MNRLFCRVVFARAVKRTRVSDAGLVGVWFIVARRSVALRRCDRVNTRHYSVSVEADGRREGLSRA